MPKFFVSPEQIEEDRLFILGEDARHIARSLRMAAGETVTVSDGRGEDFLCRLDVIRDERCECRILRRTPAAGEPPVSVTLCMAYPKGDKLETVIQKAVELGASRILPFESSRCIKRPPAEKAEKILARLSRIAEEAAKQCGRGRIPEVLPPASYAGMLAVAGECDLPLFCYEGECGSANSLKAILDGAKDPSSIAVVVGAEGGFSPEEAEQAKAAGLLPVGLGPRILRCETAPSYALSAISYRFEL